MVLHTMFREVRVEPVTTPSLATVTATPTSTVARTHLIIILIIFISLINLILIAVLQLHFSDSKFLLTLYCLSTRKTNKIFLKWNCLLFPRPVNYLKISQKNVLDNKQFCHNIINWFVGGLQNKYWSTCVLRKIKWLDILSLLLKFNFIRFASIKYTSKSDKKISVTDRMTEWQNDWQTFAFLELLLQLKRYAIFHSTHVLYYLFHKARIIFS